MKKLILLLLVGFVTTGYAQQQPSSAQCDSLNTLYGYTYLNWGAMFNVVAKTNNITLDHLTGNLKNGTFMYHIYYKTGSFLGFEQQPAAWTFIDSAQVLSNNTLTVHNQPTEIPISLNLNMNQGDTIALYLQVKNLSCVYLTSTTIPWATEYVSDSVISISVARSVYQPFNVPFSTPQIWNGTVAYCLPGTVGTAELTTDEEPFQLHAGDDQLNISFGGAVTGHSGTMYFTVTDMLGRPVAEYNVSGTTLTIATGQLSKGLYVCSLHDSAKILKQQKIIIR